jgi:hypothetical protein
MWPFLQISDLELGRTAANCFKHENVAHSISLHMQLLTAHLNLHSASADRKAVDLVSTLDSGMIAFCKAAEELSMTSDFAIGDTTLRHHRLAVSVCMSGASWKAPSLGRFRCMTMRHQPQHSTSCAIMD